MRELPARTVTLLFSDIEGSTALLSRLGGGYGAALSAQRVIMRGAIAGGGGVELGTEGDGFFVVFSSAADAVGCCVAAQRALAGYDWPGGVAVRVRMGLHAGEPSRHEDGFIGIDVHWAARIAAAAHGGQVVMSQVTWQLAQQRRRYKSFPSGLMRLVDFGDVRRQGGYQDQSWWPRPLTSKERSRHRGREARGGRHPRLGCGPCEGVLRKPRVETRRRPRRR